MKPILIAVFLLAVSVATAQTSDTSSVNIDSVYKKVDVEAKFPGGEIAWNSFLKKAIDSQIDSLLKKGEYGAYTFQFLIDSKGSISDISVLSTEDSKFAEIILKAIEESPKWIPAIKYGRQVKSWCKKEVIFLLDISRKESEKSYFLNKDDSVYTKVEIEAVFPGGYKRWNQYIHDKIEKNAEQIKNDTKSGVCEVQFLIDKEGNFSNITALTMKDSKLASVIIAAIEKGPFWIPAIQNGRQVRSWKRIKVTFPLD